MRVITMVSPKGGAGKTTMALVIAGELAERYRDQKICLIDADPNAPLQRWADMGQHPENIMVRVDKDPSGDEIFDLIDEAKENADWVLIDTEGTANIRATRTITEAGMCIIPIRASYLDVTEAAKAVKLIEGCSRTTTRKIPYALAFTQIETAITTRSYRDIETQIRGQDLPVLTVQLLRREAFVKVFAFGTTLHGLSTNDVSGLTKAQDNASLFVDSVLQAYVEGQTNE